MYFSIVPGFLCCIQTLTWVSSDRVTFITAGTQTVLLLSIVFISKKKKKKSETTIWD